MSLDTLHKSLTTKDAIADFLLQHRASRSSQRTIQNHTESLQRFSTWLEGLEITHISSISSSVLREFVCELSTAPSKTGQPLKPSTVWTHFKNIKAFFNYLEFEGEISSNPMRRLKTPKLDKTVMPAFTEEELGRLELATSGKDLLALRNRALVYFLLDTGCRLAEASSLLLTDIDLNDGRTLIRAGKGRKDRIVWLGAKALKAMIKYLRAREDGLPNLWVGQHSHITRAGMRMILEKLGKSCGVHCHAHKFRRTTALTMLRNGCDVYSIRNLLGHSDLQVLLRYLAQVNQDIKDAHDRHGVVDHMQRDRRTA